jgi:3-oxoacyl-[acyl-carrier protein] reductase
MTPDQVAGAFRLDGRVAIVTGGGSGIGRSICETFAGAGASVVLADIDDDTGAQTVERITEAGGRAVFVHADVASRADHATLADTAVSRFGGLDVLCNLGGPPAPFVEMADMTDEQLDTVFSTHVRGVLYGCQAAIPHMKRVGRGAIVNMASTAADKLSPSNGLYVLAKSQVMVMTRMLALELGPSGIRVNAIAPGATVTNFSRRYYLDDEGNVDERRRDEWMAQMARLGPLPMMGAPEDQANLVLYLVSDASRFVTGQVVRANGGWSMP